MNKENPDMQKRENSGDKQNEIELEKIEVI